MNSPNEMIHVVEPLIPALRRYARALLRDVSAADDLVQDCLEKAVSRWHQRRQGGEARAWLFAILHNLAINRLRRSQRHGMHVTLEDVEELSHPAAQEETLLNRDLKRVVASLPEDQRAVLLLVSVEGLSYAETASVLAVPLGTVMSRLSRAREKVMQLMEGQPSGHKPAAAHLRRVK